VVRSAVARFESTCATPTLASSAVAAAKRAESRAHAIQLEVRFVVKLVVGVMLFMLRGRRPIIRIFMGVDNPHFHGCSRIAAIAMESTGNPNEPSRKPAGVDANWPALPQAAWSDTCATLQ